MNKRQLQKVKKQALAKKKAAPTNVQAAWDMVAQELQRAAAKRPRGSDAVSFFVNQDFYTRRISIHNAYQTFELLTTPGVIK